MKPEPLKNKEGYVDSWQIRDKKDVHPSHITKVFEEEDIHSAVKLLKREINSETRFAKSCGNKYAVKLLNDLKMKVDQAFEDVVKKVKK